MKFVKWSMVGLLLLYTGLCLWSLHRSPDMEWSAVASGFLSFVGALGLIFTWRWTQYFIHLLTAFYAIGWPYLLWVSYAYGFLRGGMREIFLAVVPGMALLLVCLGISWFTFKHFKNPPASPNKSN